MLAIHPMLSKAGATLHPRAVCHVGEQYQAHAGANQPLPDQWCCRMHPENIRDLHPKLVWDTEANSPLLEPIGRVTIAPDPVAP